jgi:SAM-dependent methyltransferase
MSEQASRFVDSIPEFYDRELGPYLFETYAMDLAARVAELAPHRVLELAAGTGIVTRALRNALPDDCELLATDLNPPMLEWARTKFRPDENISFEPVDAMHLPFDAASFDVVVCQFGVMFFPEKEQSFREASRVLRRDGHYLFSVWDSWQANPFARMAHEVVAGIFPDDPPGFYRVPFGYSDTAAIKVELAAGGFGACVIDTLPLQVELESVQTFGHGLVFGNPLYEEIISRGGDPQLVCSAITAEVEKNLGDSMPLQAIVLDASLA